MGRITIKGLGNSITDYYFNVDFFSLILCTQSKTYCKQILPYGFTTRNICPYHALKPIFGYFFSRISVWIIVLIQTYRPRENLDVLVCYRNGLQNNRKSKSGCLVSWNLQETINKKKTT